LAGPRLMTDSVNRVFFTTGERMRFSCCLLPLTVFTGFALLVSPSGACAQETGSDLSATVAAQLPDAPRPQVAMAAIETEDQKLAAASDPQTGIISGTVLDLNGDVVPGATVVLDGAAASDHRTTVANDNGLFEFGGLTPGTSYHVTVSAPEFTTWKSPALVLAPAQTVILTDIKLTLQATVSSVTVSAAPEEIAVEQVKIEEQQRIFGIIPNFYVVYDSNAAPLTTKLKYKLALRTARDPLAFLATAFLAGLYQASATPDYVGGMKGYGQRMGSIYAGGFTDIMMGGAVLPSLLHQDPRYFYQGTGTKKSRALHAMSNPFVCKGDNGHLQVNYSSMGGDLIAGSVANLYYPTSNRGAGLVFTDFAIDTSERLVSSLVQEFILGKYTHRPQKKN